MTATGAAHPSRLDLERLSADDLPEAARPTLEAHVAACARCRGLLEEVAGLRRERLALHPPEAFVARLEARRPRRALPLRAFFGAGAAAALAAAVILLLPQRQTDDDLRLKGGGAVVHLRRAGVARIGALTAGGRVRAGDELRIVLTAPRAGQVQAAFVDAAGRVDALFPPGGATLAQGEHALPDGFTVEAPCRDMALVVAFGSEATEALSGALARLNSGAVRDPAAATWAPPGTIVQTLTCE